MEKKYDKGKKKKCRLSRRGVLYICDAVMFVILTLICLFHAAMRHINFYDYVPSYLLIYFAFVAASIVIYYLSIMASALSRAYLEKEKEENEEQK